MKYPVAGADEPPVQLVANPGQEPSRGKSVRVDIPQHPLRSAADLDPLLKQIGDARVVLLGEASHGTHEYYTWRAALSKRL